MFKKSSTSRLFYPFPGSPYIDFAGVRPSGRLRSAPRWRRSSRVTIPPRPPTIATSRIAATSPLLSDHLLPFFPKISHFVDLALFLFLVNFLCARTRTISAAGGTVISRHRISSPRFCRDVTGAGAGKSASLLFYLLCRYSFFS